MNPLIFFANILDPRDKLEYMSYQFEELYGKDNGKKYLENVQAAMLELFGDYAATYYVNVQQSSSDSSSGSQPDVPPVQELELVKRGSRRYIGDGRETKIGTDHWLPVEENPYVQSALHGSVSEATISCLMNTQGTGWDVDCVRDVFNERDSNMILNIPISKRKPRDGWYWFWDQRGAYTAKSAYKQLTLVAHDPRPWTKIWNLFIPPKEALNSKRVACSLVCHMCRRVDESAVHMFVHCSEAMKIWNKLGVQLPTGIDDVSTWFFTCLNTLGVDLVEKFVMACLGIWMSRNDYVWKGVCFDLNHMLRRFLTFLENWQHANSTPPAGVTRLMPTNVSHWVKPKRGMLKFNTYAAIRDETHEMGLDWVLRDDEGRFFAAKNMCLSGNYAVKEAEAICIREALKNGFPSCF
ncbi:PREDICTED: uncharacterized protein LOC109189683 [Ipomoea nil]|uniref:uncharacterized protein LOC109189683 n=1 Tax=Ipomoea nil TaxID=35883 RepID=UPI000901874A|nr:PREDICTED: uncharacterized protein LOC109189683 [Ipomoea nil]